jgi:quinol-cytochrome oxidoreductase complex cytochrome b subunit
MGRTSKNKKEKSPTSDRTETKIQADSDRPSVPGRNIAPSRIRRFFLFHIKPSKLPKEALRLSHTFGLGGSAAVLFALLLVTGMLLMLVYEANPEGAYDSVAGLSAFRFGGFVRNIHHWSANLLFAVAILHMLRVFYTGGFHGPRRINWIVGVLLLFGVMGASFTGYLLPWDQLAYWAVTISTGMLGYVPLIGHALQDLVRGGDEIGTDALVVFYAIHTSFLPLFLLALMGFHFWRVRKAGGVVVPHPLDGVPEEAPERVPAYPDLLLRELTWGLMLVAIVLVLAVFFDAPLGDRANPGMSPNPAKAPWYFIGFQELQLHLHPLLAAVVAPLLVTAALVALPYLNYGTPLGGSWFLTVRGRRSTFVIAVVTAVLTASLAIADDLWLRPAAGAPALFGRGVMPLLVVAALVLWLRHLLKRRFSATPSETVQALFTVLLSAFTTLSAIAIWFRGSGMTLTLPWWTEGP